MKASLSTTFKLLINESAFVEDELQHLEEKRRSGEAYQPSETFRDEAQSRAQDKRRNLLRTFLLMSGLIVGGATIAVGLNHVTSLSWTMVRLVRAISILLVGWAVFGKLADVETFKGETLLELTSAYLYKCAYSAGILVGALALFLEGPAAA